MLEDQLKNLGLSEGEVKTYLASLELGSDTVIHLARRAGIKRPTCYVMIESLTRKGLISSFTKGKKRYFSPENPEKILDIILGQKSEIESKEKGLENILPELISLFNLSEKKPRVRFFEGKEGIKTIQRDILKTKASEIFEFVAIDPAFKLFPPTPGDHRQKITKKYKSIKVIYTGSKGKILSSKEGLTERRFIPEKKFPFSVEINIYGNKLAIASSTGTIMGVIIESEEIANTMRSIFNLSWEAAAKYN